MAANSVAALIRAMLKLILLDKEDLQIRKF